MKNDLSMIIRSVGERTTEVCSALLANASPATPIHIITAAPFSAAIRKSFELAITLQRKWTLVIDADVLVRSAFIDEIIAFANHQDNDLFVVQGLVYDKIFNLLRPAGNHLYRTALLKEALSVIPEEGTTLRPESGTIDAMVASGYSFVQKDFVAGLHDYEQELLDIAKKCFIQAHKHEAFAHAVWPQWEDKAGTDPDFKAAMQGVEAGRKYSDVLYIDNSFVEARILEFYGRNHFPLKPPLFVKDYDDAVVSRILEQALADPDRPHMQTRMFPPERWTHIYSQKRVEACAE